MKKILVALPIVALAFSLTACGDSLEKLSEDGAKAGVKCFNGEFTKEECLKADAEITERLNKFTKEEQKQYREMLGAKLKEKWEKYEKENKGKKKK